MRGQVGAWSQGRFVPPRWRVSVACWCVCPVVVSTDVCKGALPACTVRSEASRVDYNSFGNSLFPTSRQVGGYGGPLLGDTHTIQQG